MLLFLAANRGTWKVLLTARVVVGFNFECWGYLLDFYIGIFLLYTSNIYLLSIYHRPGILYRSCWEYCVYINSTFSPIPSFCNQFYLFRNFWFCCRNSFSANFQSKIIESFLLSLGCSSLCLSSWESLI